MDIKNNITKQVTLTNSITVDDVIVRGQSATINRETKEITLSSWTNDMSLYKTNRVIIRKLEAEFEEMAFNEQDKMIAETENE